MSLELQDFFHAVDMKKLQGKTEYEDASWFHALDIYNGESIDLKGKKLALIGIEEPGEKTSSSYEVRKYLYRLKRAEYAEEVVDLGNFRFDYKPKSYQTLGFVLSELINIGITPVIINGRQDITYAQYLAFTYLKRYVNLVSFDSKLDFNLHENEQIDGNNYLQNIFISEPSYLFHFTNIGYQSHFADTSILNFMEKLFFDMHRLGDARANINELEPELRSAHFVSWDISAIRQSDAPGTSHPSPNGLFGEEACLLSRYAGLSNNVKSIGFFEYLPKNDIAGQTAHLAAQMIWYFTDGFLARYDENPLDSRDEFLKFITNIQNNSYQIVFFKSKRTDRWWMEVPINEREFSGSHHIVPCSYSDYITATREEIPERWWQAMKKLS